jgi:hypothetical protein
MEVKPFSKHFEHDDGNGPNMATVCSDRGFAPLSPTAAPLAAERLKVAAAFSAD